MSVLLPTGGFLVFGVAENSLILVEAFRNKLEPEMKFLEDKGLWKMLLRKLVSNFMEGMETGIIYCFQTLEGKKILKTSH